MRFVKKKKKLDELIDSSLNIIDGDEVDSTSIIKSKETTDQNMVRTRQRRNPLGGYNTGGSYGYYFGESEEKGKFNYDKVFIQPEGKGIFKQYRLIAYPSFDLLDMFFSSPEEAQKFAEKNNIKLIKYSEGDYRMNENKNRVKKIVEDLLHKTSDEYDIQNNKKINQIPSLESLENHHPIVGRNTKILIDSIKNREGVDPISDSIIIDQILSIIDVESIPYNLKKILLRKLQNGGNSNIVNENTMNIADDEARDFLLSVKNEKPEEYVRYANIIKRKGLDFAINLFNQPRIEKEKSNKNIEQKRIIKRFVDEIGEDFYVSLIQQADTQQPEKNLLSVSDSTFYFLVGQYINESSEFDKYYDSLDSDEKINIIDPLGDEIVRFIKNKFNKKVEW